MIASIINSGMKLFIHSATVQVWDGISNFIQHFTEYVFIHAGLMVKLW